jgi:hypothetical protein
MALLATAFREGLFGGCFAGGIEYLGFVAAARDPSRLRYEVWLASEAERKRVP